MCAIMGHMGRSAFPARSIQLAINVLVVAFWVYWWWFDVHQWPLRIFIVGFMATGVTAGFMANARRRRGVREALIPCLMGTLASPCSSSCSALHRAADPGRLHRPRLRGHRVGRSPPRLLVARRAATAPVARSARDPEGV